MQLESFISFIRQANTYGESENWALCCSCIVLCWEVLSEAGADIGPVIKELQSNRKKSTSQHKEEGAHQLERNIQDEEETGQRCFQAGGR